MKKKIPVLDIFFCTATTLLLFSVYEDVAYSSYLGKALKLDFYPNIPDDDFEEARKQARI